MNIHNAATTDTIAPDNGTQKGASNNSAIIIAAVGAAVGSLIVVMSSYNILNRKNAAVIAIAEQKQIANDIFEKEKDVILHNLDIQSKAADTVRKKEIDDYDKDAIQEIKDIQKKKAAAIAERLDAMDAYKKAQSDSNRLDSQNKTKADDIAKSRKTELKTNKTQYTTDLNALDKKFKDQIENCTEMFHNSRLTLKKEISRTKESLANCYPPSEYLQEPKDLKPLSSLDY